MIPLRIVFVRSELYLGTTYVYGEYGGYSTRAYTLVHIGFTRTGYIKDLITEKTIDELALDRKVREELNDIARMDGYAR